jgi:hypothetical protein
MLSTRQEIELAPKWSEISMANQRAIASVAQDDSPPNLETHRSLVHHWITRAPNTQINRRTMRGSSGYRLFHLHGIARANDAHIGKSPHHRDVFERMVRWPIMAVTVSATQTHDRNGQFVITDVVADMLEAAQSGERSNRVSKRPHAAQSQPGRYADHVALCDAHIQEPAGKFGRKLVEDLISQIAGEQHHSRILPRGRGQPANKRRPHPLISSNARLRSWSLGGR